MPADTTGGQPRTPPAPAKRAALAQLGEEALLLPAMVNSGLAANDRAKYLMSLLQAAKSAADAPSAPHPSLRAERVAAGVGDGGLDDVVSKSERVNGQYLIPQAARIHRDLADAIAEMLAPLSAADAAGDDAGRLATLLDRAPDLTGDLVPGEYIASMTSARPAEADSLHLLVMDAHKQLNQLQARLATDMLHGAAVYGLTEADKALVTEFMAGLHETAPLKFAHPGLGTTGTRLRRRLLIQNDLGTTAAHVVVIAVAHRTVTITYTDVHLRRLHFFESLFRRYDVRWSGADRAVGAAALGEHYLTTGVYEAPDDAALRSYLRYVGSRLVFVLDWNKARKRLRRFLREADAVSVLSWAADSNFGHIAFLSLGGERLVYDAIELASSVPARYGEPLTDVLGRDGTIEITKFALRTASEGLLAGQSQLLIRDRLRVEVLRHVEASQRGLLDAAAGHAGLIVETAQVLQAALACLGTTTDADAFLTRATRRAAGWEHRADEILTAQRQDAQRVDGGEAITRLTASADDAIDELEETVFLLTLLPREAAPTLRPILLPVAAIAEMAAREHLKATEIARQVVDAAAPEDMEDFLLAIDRLATLEHEADKADRNARAALVGAAPDFRSLYVSDGVSRGAEEATDALLRAGLGLREQILGLLRAR